MGNEQLSDQTTPETQPDPILTKEQKAYEKKLKQYEKDKARWEYFQANKERILKNRDEVEKNNNFEKKEYENIKTEVEAWNNPDLHGRGFVSVSKIETIIRDRPGISLYEWIYDHSIWKYTNDPWTRINRELQIHSSDKKFNFSPTYTWSYICTAQFDSWISLILYPIFSFPPLPKKPTSPEKPKPKEIKQQLSELKQEVAQTKEMNISRKTYGDTVPTKLEVISDGKTIKVNKETYDLYIQYKATRKERPHDLDLSFDHFKATYLDKHPQFMRKEKK
jgi:hypothetical protein